MKDYIANQPLTGQEAAIIVAHPDDEILWAGGTILMNPWLSWTVIALSRGSDPDRAPRFFKVLEHLKAAGNMGDLDDGPEQNPLPTGETSAAILTLLPEGTLFDLLLTHSPQGEYTRHRRHEEVGLTVTRLWQEGRIRARELLLFAYEDGNRRYYPRAVETATCKATLPDRIFQEKYRIITELYGFAPDSFEVKTTPAMEAFWRFSSPEELKHWLSQGGNVS